MGLRVDPLWLKAPFVLLRFPGLLAAVALGSSLLALAAASYPLFLSATSGAALEKEIERVDRFAAGISVEDRSLPLALQAPRGSDEGSRYELRDRLFATAVAESGLLATPVITRLGPPAWATTSDGGVGRDVRIASRTGALDHVLKLEGRDGDGAWVADGVARDLGLDPGDHILLSSPRGRRVRVPIDGVYRSIFNLPRTPYWSSLAGLIYPTEIGGNEIPAGPPFLLVDSDQAIELTRALGERNGFFRWEAPISLAAPLTLEEARRVRDLAARLGSSIDGRTTEFGRAFSCRRCFFPRSPLQTFMPQVIRAGELRVGTVSGPVQLLFAAGMFVAAAVIAGAGAFAMLTRRVENNLLYARGAGPGSIAAKSALESLIPSVAGGLAGFGAASLLVSLIGPDGAVATGAELDGARAAGFSIPASLVLLSSVSAAAFQRRSEGSGRFRSWSRFPFEVGLLVAAGALLNRLTEGGALTTQGAGGVARPSLFLLLFPLLFVGGCATLGARGFRAVMGRVRDRSERLSHPIYLMVHRISGASGLVVLLFSACALCLGIFIHAQTIVRSLGETVVAKSLLYVGSDVQATVDLEDELPDAFPLPSTKVIRIVLGGSVEGRGNVDLLAVDPETLARVAHWDPAFGADSLKTVLQDLDGDPGSGGELAVIVAGGELPNDPELTIEGDAIPVRVEGEVDAFPGTSSQRPLLVVAEPALSEALMDRGGSILSSAQASTEFWVKGDTAAAVEALGALEDPPYSVLTAEEVRDIPSISAVIATFGVLNVLGLGAGLLVIVVLLLYLQARQRARLVSYGLARRMGLSRSDHRMALVAELGALFLVSYVVGVAVALPASNIVLGMIDPLPTIPPAPLFSPPVAIAVSTGFFLASVAVLGGIVTDRIAARANLADVMRLAD